MKEGNMWWKLGSASQLLRTIGLKLKADESFVLHAQSLPWQNSFFDAVELHKSGSQRLIRRVSWDGKCLPAEFVLNNLCDCRTRAAYWPGQEAGAYLAGLDGIALNDCCVWVSGLHTRPQLMAWIEFVKQYLKHAPDVHRRAMFVLQFDGDHLDSGIGMDVRYQAKSYEGRVFAMELAAALKNTDSVAYQAELALALSFGNPELCAELLHTGEQLLKDPEGTASELLRTGRDSTGRPYGEKDPAQISSAVWKACISLLFPVVEEYRLELLSKYADTIQPYLPISYAGETITDPMELELGPLHYLTCNSRLASELSEEEHAALSLCRTVRNYLAHNRALSYPVVKQVLALSRDSDD